MQECANSHPGHSRQSDSDDFSVACKEARLSSDLAFPKGVELFASDIHGEYESFCHMLRSASGLIGERIDVLFADRPEEWRANLASVVCYPQERLAAMACERNRAGEHAEACVGEHGCEGKWGSESERARSLACPLELDAAVLSDMVHSLASLARSFASSRSLSKVCEAIGSERMAIVGELLRGSDGEAFSQSASALVERFIDRGCASSLIALLAELVRGLCVERLHVVGDIYDRGPAPDLVMELLAEQPFLDIQWGNHDVVWMGASLGQRGCIAHVVRNCARYGNLSILEDAYGIDLTPLKEFAASAYAEDPCIAFGLKGSPDLPEDELGIAVKVQKAMAIMQFKVEGALIDEHPEYGLADRKLLHRIDYAAGTVEVDGAIYRLTDTVFPTVDAADPYSLTDAEEEVMARLEEAFIGSEKLQRHMSVLLERGSLCTVSNDVLMLHACVPLNSDGSLMKMEVCGKVCKGASLYDAMEDQVRAAFSSPDAEARNQGRDMLWYLWLGPVSPLFAKSKMATFELYLIADKAARKEVKNPFYSLMDDEAVITGIFEDFGLDPEHARLVCGHVPVKVKDGEDPVKCAGRVIAIDGGYSKAYQPTTGIAGFTLISNAEGVFLDSHEPFAGFDAAIGECAGLRSHRRIIERYDVPKTIADTDEGARLTAVLDGGACM